MIIRQLRPGRHQLSREEVKSHQRSRIFAALEAVMSDKGYLDASVADVIKVAGVSRQTFYQLFASKRDCFLASYEQRQRAVIAAVLETPPAESPMDAFCRLLRSYLAIMAAEPGLSRLYLIGVYTAGPEAIAKRLDLQQQFVDGVALLFGANSAEDRVTCQGLVAMISTMVTNALLTEDAQAVLDLYEPLIGMTRRLMNAESHAVRADATP